MFELRVLSGLHQQAALPLVGDEWYVGAREEADLALFDPGIEAHHGALHLQAEQWRLEAHAGAFYDAEGEVLIGTILPEQLFRAANIWLCVAPCDAPWASETVPLEMPALKPVPPLAPSSAQPLVRWPWLWVLLPVLMAVMAAGGMLWTPTPLTQVTPLMPQALSPSKPALETAEQVRTALRLLLDERGLHTVTLNDADKVVLLSADPTQEPILRRVLRVFQQRYRSAIAVSLDLRPTVQTLPFRVVQVVAGGIPHLLTDQGTRMFIGDESEGVRLIAIDPTKLRFDGSPPLEVDW